MSTDARILCQEFLDSLDDRQLEMLNKLLKSDLTMERIIETRPVGQYLLDLSAQEKKKRKAKVLEENP